MFLVYYSVALLEKNKQDHFTTKVFEEFSTGSRSMMQHINALEQILRRFCKMTAGHSEASMLTISKKLGCEQWYGAANPIWDKIIETIELAWTYVLRVYTSRI